MGMTTAISNDDARRSCVSDEVNAGAMTTFGYLPETGPRAAPASMTVRDPYATSAGSPNIAQLTVFKGFAADCYLTLDYADATAFLAVFQPMIDVALTRRAN
jgi:hypothetical protein